jgi:hypothetical protein
MSPFHMWAYRAESETRESGGQGRGQACLTGSLILADRCPFDVMLGLDPSIRRHANDGNIVENQQRM